MIQWQKIRQNEENEIQRRKMIAKWDTTDENMKPAPKYSKTITKTRNHPIETNGKEGKLENNNEIQERENDTIKEKK